MSKIISIHSFRGGTGKSNVTANLAVLTALKGNRVGIVDTDVQSPGIHVLFGFDEERIQRCLNDYLWDRCRIEETAYDVTDSVAAGAPARTKVFLIPSSLRAGEIARVLREGYDVSRLNDGFRDLVQKLELDYLFIDTHPGVNEETLLSIAISDTLLVVLRADNQDFQGTAVTVDLARRLETPQILLLLNKVLAPFDEGDLSRKLNDTYHVPVAGILPLSEDMVRLASGGVFSLHHPDHVVTRTLRQVAEAVG